MSCNPKSNTFCHFNQDEITDEDEINKQIQTEIIETYLESYEGVISEDEVFKSLKSMQNNESPGNHGLSMEICE